MVECTVNQYPIAADVNRAYDAHTLRRVQAGWPMSALEGVATVDGRRWGDWSFSCMIPAPGWCQPGTHSEPIGYVRGRTYLPLRVLPLGFGCNTMLLAAPVLVPLLIRDGLRRWRLRRGRCTACGYSRHGLVGGADAKCPECGTVPTPASK
jgi:hypothetical protein